MPVVRNSPAVHVGDADGGTGEAEREEMAEGAQPVTAAVAEVGAGATPLSQFGQE
jgi:hypothetical protein